MPGYEGEDETNLIDDDIEPLLVDFESLDRVKDDLGEDLKLVVVSIDGEEDTIGLAVEGVAQTCEVGIVRVLDERVADELSEESGLDGVEGGVVDEGTAHEEERSCAGYPPAVVLLVPETRDGSVAKTERALGGLKATM